MKKFSFMIAFLVWLAVFFWARTFDIRNAEDRTLWATIFATILSTIVYLGIQDVIKQSISKD